MKLKVALVLALTAAASAAWACGPTAYALPSFGIPDGGEQLLKMRNCASNSGDNRSCNYYVFGVNSSAPQAQSALQRAYVAQGWRVRLPTDAGLNV